MGRGNGGPFTPMKPKLASVFRQSIFTAQLLGAMIFGLWLFEPLGLTSLQWNFIDLPSGPVAAVIFFTVGTVPAAGLAFLLPRLRVRFGRATEEDTSFFRGIFLGPVGGLFLALICLPGLGRVGYHHVGSAVNVIFFFLLVPSSILGSVVGAHLPRKLRQAALVPVIVFTGALAGYLLLKIIVRVLP